MAQSLILQTLKAQPARDQLRELLAAAEFDSRTDLSRRVCEQFDFRDARGRLQIAGCQKVLRALQAKGLLVLPAPLAAAPDRTPIQLAAPLPAPAAVPERLAALGALQLSLVTKRAERAIWNTLIAREHPHGMTTFAGCQLRYLVHSAEYGYLAALGFSAAALQLAARDRWMAWSPDQRAAHLERVVGLSRFLIRPGVRCRYFASHVLGRVLRRLAADFEARYGYRPWLVETFVGAGHNGASLRAANFLRLGPTTGRGRQDRGKRDAGSIKTVYVYELERHWRRRLGVPPVEHAPVLELGAGLDSRQWAAHEFGGSEMGDRRLTARLVKSAGLLAEYPGQPVCGNAHCDSAAVSGYYRFIEQPSETAVTVQSILSGHRQRTLQRMRGQRTVLLAMDGSDLNFATRPGCAGLELIGSNQTRSQTLGLHLHLTLAVNPQGLPLGVLRCGFDGREKHKKTQRWVVGLQDIQAACEGLTRRTRVIAVCDREADFFELFERQRQEPRVELLVRAKHDRVLQPQEHERVLEPQEKLLAKLSKGPPVGHVEVELERLSERRKSSKKKARPKRSKRTALCELRFRRLSIPATQGPAEPVTLWGVRIVELHPPEEEEAVSWTLLTSLEVGDVAGAVEVIDFYLQRWRIEDFFRVLKSGCRVEYLAFHRADRLQRAIAINAVIAWRIMLMTLLGRDVPNCAASLMFTDEELAFLRDYAQQYSQSEPQDLSTAVRLVALLGGYRARKHDPAPGNQIMWRGYQRLSAATLGHRIALEAGSKIALVTEKK